MKKELTNLMTKEHGKFASNLKVKELISLVEKHSKEGTLLELPLLDQEGTIGIGMQTHQVMVDKIAYLDLNIIDIVGYETVIYKAIED